MMSKLIFINYISRSGSTFLCSELAKLPGVEVGIEAGFPGFPDRLIPNKFKPIRSKSQLSDYLALLYEDIRFKEWKVDRLELENALSSLEFPISFKEIFTACIDGYFPNVQSTSFLVHKAGGYMNDLDFCDSQFPNSKHIFIVRDPRSIYNSQKQAIDLYSSKNMGSNVLPFISEYKRRVGSAIRLSKSHGNILVIKYEDMVDNLKGTMEQVKQFVQFDSDPLKTELKSENYADRIPENQRSLHANVGKSANPALKNRWKEGLTEREVSFIELGLQDLMIDLGYKAESKKVISIKDWFELRLKLLVFAVRKKVKLALLDSGFAS